MSLNKNTAAALTGAVAAATEPVQPPVDLLADQDTEPPEQAAANPQTVEVRALVDDARLGLVCGALAVVPVTELGGLKTSGLVDDHPDAVSFARSLAIA